jgi:hypothetical protein
MTTPPFLLIRTLQNFPHNRLIDLRDHDRRETISVSHAISLAIRGTVEGVGSRGGKIRYVRMLDHPAIAPESRNRQEPECHNSRSTAIARTNLGVYREPLHEVAVEERKTLRVVASEGGIVAHVWSHCELRGVA